MMTRDQLSCLRTGDRILRTDDDGNRDVGTVIELGAHHAYVAWRGSRTTGIIGLTTDNPRLDLLDGPFGPRPAATMTRVPQTSRLADAWTAYVVMPVMVLVSWFRDRSTRRRP